MRLKENNQLKLISFLIAILLFISVNENFKNLRFFSKEISLLEALSVHEKNA